MIQKLFWKLFPPFEVRLTKEAVDAFLNTYPSTCTELIRAGVNNFLRDTERVVYPIRIDHMKPDQLALILITNVLAEHLQSGQFHVYRGILGMVGQDMLKLWDIAAKDIRKLGYHTEEEMQKELTWIREQIKQMG